MHYVPFKFVADVLTYSLDKIVAWGAVSLLCWVHIAIGAALGWCGAAHVGQVGLREHCLARAFARRRRAIT